MNIDTYKKATSYENFMTRAFNTDDRSKPGIDISYMSNLIDAEDGESPVTYLPSFEKQLIKIKFYIDKAFDKLIERRRSEVKIRTLMYLKDKAKSTHTSKELLIIIEQALELTKDLKQ